MKRITFKTLSVVALSVVMTACMGSVAFADVTTSIPTESITAKTTQASFDDESFPLDISFADQNGTNLSATLEEIVDETYGSYFGDKAFVANVIVPRGAEVNMNVDNFVKGAEYPIQSYGETYVKANEKFTVAGTMRWYARKSTIRAGLLESGDPNYLAAYLSDGSTLLTDAMSSHQSDWYQTEEFFGESYVYKLAVEDRTSFDSAYMIENQNEPINMGIWRVYVYFTYAEDKDAADKIKALPDAADVTLESAEQIAAARAAYDLLAQWEGAQGAIDATKLVDAEAKLAELQKAAATTELEQAIAEAEKVDTSKLTDEQKKALQDAIDIAKAALANGELAAGAIVDAKDAIAAATSTAQGQVAEAVKAAEEAAKAKTELKANPMKVKAKTVKAKAKKKTVIKKAKAFVIKGAQGKVTFKKMSGNKKIKVSKAGKVTVKKGLKKGKTYKVKVLVSAAGNAQYKPMAKTVTLKVKIK